jgi:predicted protein tyrosine phosphatase
MKDLYIEFDKEVVKTLSGDTRYRLLFVCEGNAQRSPTFQSWFEMHKPEYNVRSTGTAFAYMYPLDEQLLLWADTIYCMDLEQDRFIKRKFQDYYYKVKIVGCSDQYNRESLQLYRIIEHWVEKERL